MRFFLITMELQVEFDISIDGVYPNYFGWFYFRNRNPVSPFDREVLNWNYFEHPGCLPSLHRWCSCGADGVKSGGKYGQYRHTYRHMYDTMESIPPYIRYGQIVRALDFPLNQLVQGSSPWRITNRIFQSLPDWQALFI
jgi:hypothetical protein